MFDPAVVPLCASQPTPSLTVHMLGEVVSQENEDRAETPEKQTAKPPDSPMAVFADIEKAWNSQNVDLLLKHYGKARVTISIGGDTPRGGDFSRNQSYYLFKDLFKYTITRKFEFVQYRRPDDSGKSTFAVAERQYQRTDDGRTYTDKIFVSLHMERDAEEERWVVDEIKSIR